MFTKYRKFFILGFLSILFVIGLLRVFIFDFYRVPTESMTPVISPGHYIIVYKAKLIQESYFKNPNVNLKRGEIWVFNKPNYATYKGNLSIFKGPEYVKRCLGIPGDHININRPSYASLNGYPSKLKNPDSNKLVFPHNADLNWSLNKFGPLLVPKKDTRIVLSKRNLILYKDIIEYEGNSLKIENDKILLNNVRTSIYAFKLNYYFMIGDNFYDSEDSRSWGLVPESNFIGKVIMVL